ncbi:MAG: crotonase/enoyl-CoA hydratase family protein [Thiotrichales bacterium]|nr:crotonase/enoyl-CoA hydratase family protein [Thiotrichales bacterium]
MNTVRFANEARFNQFKHLEVQVVPETRSVWIYLNAKPRACITTTLLKELREFQSQLIQYEGRLPWEGQLVDIEYHVVTSRHPVFSFGGDLDHFLDCLKRNDRESLRQYGRDCIDTMYPNLTGFGSDITTISLVHGNALGGGFEAALSSHIVIAERRVEMGLPEVLFNLFPGMGAYQLISQRTNPATAEKMMLSGRLYSAEELYGMGLIESLADDGEGVSAVNSFIRADKKRHNARNSIRKVRQRVNPVEYEELLDVCDIWVDAAFNLEEKDLRTMARLVRSQLRFAGSDNNDLPIHEDRQYI